MSIAQGQRKAWYTEEERKIIDVHKEEYLKATSAVQRRQIAQHNLCPALFNYWRETERTVEDPQAETKKLIDWVRNNWRGVGSSEARAVNVKVKRTDLIWNTRREDVFREIAKLCGLETADTTTPDWFKYRMKALGNILANMTAEEMEQLDVEASKIANTGYPEEQRRKLAEKYSTSRLSKGAKQNFLEMGLLNVSFVTWTTPDGQLAIEVHDDIAGLMGVHARPFETQFPNQVTEMKRLIIGYVKTLKGMLNAPLDGLELAPSEELPTLLTEGGLPKVLSALKLESRSKPVLAILFKNYLGEHYFVATKGRTRQIPFKSLSENLSHYIDREYLPQDYKISEPRNMKRAQLIAFFNHIYDRQLLYDLPAVFQFKAVNDGRKSSTRKAAIQSNEPDGHIIPDPDSQDADAGNSADADEPSPRSQVRRPRPRPLTKRKEKTIQREVENDTSSTCGGVLPDPSLDTINTHSVPDELIDPRILGMSMAPSGSALVLPTSAFETNSTLPPCTVSSTGQSAQTQTTGIGYVFPSYVSPAVGSPSAQPTVAPGHVFPPDIMPFGVSPPCAGPGTAGEMVGITSNRCQMDNSMQPLHNGLPSPFSQFSETATLLSPNQLPAFSTQPTPANTGIGIPRASNAKGANRTAIRTADNLALLEANKFKVSGKRKPVPKARG